MATFTPNYNLGKPDSTDAYSLFLALFNDNMDKIDNISGGGGVTYSLSISDHTITLNGSDGSSSSVTVPDDDTTYSISFSGGVLTLTDSNGNDDSVTLPDTKYLFSISGNVITITDSDGVDQTITLPTYTNAHTIIDGSGSSMTQRSGLQFQNATSVTDDSVNDRTIVQVLPFKITGNTTDGFDVTY